MPTSIRDRSEAGFSVDLAQSRVVPSRAALEKKVGDIAARYPDGNPPRPKHWGGYRVDPVEIEFWQSGEFRLHDRVRYRRGPRRAWKLERLSP